jgi:hypothetical protein
VVWNLLLPAGSEGPTLIDQAVTHIGPSSALLRSWRTVIRIVHHVRPKLFPPPGLPKPLQYPVHVQIREPWTDHPALRSTAIMLLSAR